MSGAQNFIPFDGLTANVQVAKALLEEYNIELSTVKTQISRIKEEASEAEKQLRMTKRVMREELQRQIEKLRNQERTGVQQLAAQYDAQRVPFEDEMKLILAKIDKVKGSIAPVRKLPAEILGNIFREVVSCDISPWSLATVSKSWRITSLTTPSLWSNIYVGTCGWHHGKLTRWTIDGVERLTSGNRLVCGTLVELAYSVEKSGAVPLDVLIDWELAEDREGILKCLLGERYSSRISSISLYRTATSDESTSWTIGRLPLLRTLDCSSLSDPVIKLIISHAIQLDTLKTRVELSSSLVRHPAWTSLRVLNVGEGTKLADFNGIVPQLGRIEQLFGVPYGWPNAVTPKVTLEHIKNIALYCKPEHILHLRLPRLERLHWSGIGTMLPRSSASGSDNNWNHSYPNVLWVEAKAVGDAFETLLGYLPNVKTVLLHPLHGGRDLWAPHLLKRLTSAENMLCPQLRHLKLGSSDYEIGTSKTLAKPLIKRLIRSRVEMRRPLEHFEVAWTRRSGKAAETSQYV